MNNFRRRDTKAGSCTLWKVWAVVATVFVVWLLQGCAPVTEGSPTVVAPPPSETEPRVIYITQRAPEGIPYNDIFLTMRATKGGEEVNIGTDASSLASIDPADSRCFEVSGSNLVSCDLGNLDPGGVVEPVAVTVQPGVRLSCNSAAFVGGGVLDYRPLPCLSAPNPPR